MSEQILLSKMIRIVAVAHDGQFDKAGVPYQLHCFKVLHYTRTEDEELKCIALGHDLFEDTKVTDEDLLAEGMTPRIIKGIQDLTKIQGQSYTKYQEKVLSNRDACLVKLADLRHNMDLRRMKGLEEKDFERQKKYSKFYDMIQKKLLEFEKF